MSVAKVFIPHFVEVRSETNQRTLPQFDFSDAARFGELAHILEPSDDMTILALLTPKIRKALENFSDDDYFMAVGDPAVIAVCAGVILRRHEKMKLLKWDKKTKMYISMEVSP